MPQHPLAVLHLGRHPALFKWSQTLLVSFLTIDEGCRFHHRMAVVRFLQVALQVTSQRAERLPRVIHARFLGDSGEKVREVRIQLFRRNIVDGSAFTCRLHQPVLQRQHSGYHVLDGLFRRLHAVHPVHKQETPFLVIGWAESKRKADLGSEVSGAVLVGFCQQSERGSQIYRNVFIHCTITEALGVSLDNLFLTL